MKSATAIAEAFSQYAYSVSHDLSAPVRAMVEFSKLLAESNGAKLDAEGKECLNLVVENGVKLQKMMEGLLQYSRLETAASPFSAVAMDEVMVCALRAVQPKIQQSQAQIIADPLPVVSGDASQLLLVMRLLLENALLYVPRGVQPQIHVTAQQQGKEWKIAIADNGIGIRADFRKKIFRLFQRLHNEEEYPGIGIGLTLAQAIVERHGGVIEIDPNVTTGTCFYFTLPNDERGAA